MQAALSLAHTMAQHKIHLVYGGGSVGLMGEVARTLVSLSGTSNLPIN
jgi:predicted Rossmann-fold nucleotide-binding protein